MKYRLTLLALCLVAAVKAQMQMNVQQLADFIRSELALHQQSDKKIAEYVKKIQLTEKLTDKTILDLQAQGAGPKTVDALQYLKSETANLKPPSHDSTYSPATAPDSPVPSGSPTATLSASPAPIPPPNSVKQKQILDLMKQYALSYTQNLPNFICVEVTRQSVDFDASDHYRSIGTILAKVSYNEGQEHYQVYSVNDKMVDTTMDRVNSGGARSTGEFAGLMRSVFEPKSEAEFGWEKWATLRGRRMAVFNYSIDSGHSSYSISYEDQHIITAYQGLVYADPNTGEIDRIKFVAVDIPKSFPVQATTEILDYDLVEINSQQYIVPLAAKLYMTAGRQKSYNEIEFRNYRKFGTESSVTYDMDPKAPAPLPASKTEEQPATSGPPNGSNSGSRSGSSPWTLPSAPPPPPPK